MQSSSVSTRVSAAALQQSGAPSGGVQGFIGDMLRSGGAGMATASRQTALAADKAAIHPFESMMTLTGLLKNKTAKYPSVGKATSLVHTVAGFGMLILSGTTTGSIKAAGSSYEDLAQRVADAIDGKKTANGWFNGVNADRQSDVGAALAQLGVK